MEKNNNTEIKNIDKPQIEVIPAILPKSFSHLEQEVDYVKKAVQVSAEYVQVDVVDGDFATSKTWPYNQESHDMWDLLVEQEIGLPHWDMVSYEIDLMVMDQLGESYKWISAGASRLIGHIESFDKNFTNQLKLDEYTKITQSPDYKFDLDAPELQKFISLKHEFDVEIMLSLNPSTKLSVIEPFLPEIDGVQFMGNDRIGYHGVELDEKVLPMISELRQKRPEMPIGIDIGVNFKTLEKLKEAGVTRFSSGSAILKSEDPRKTIIDMLSVLGA